LTEVFSEIDPVSLVMYKCSFSVGQIRERELASSLIGVEMFDMDCLYLRDQIVIFMPVDGQKYAVLMVVLHFLEK